MARKDFGELAGHVTKLEGLQAGSTLTYLDDGQIQGEATFVCDAANTAVFPDIGDNHPKDSTAKLFKIIREYNEVGKITFRCSYIGLDLDPTIPVAQYAGGSNQQPIETNPRFKSFAGDVTVAPSDPQDPLYVYPLMLFKYTHADDTKSPKPIREKIGTQAELETFETDPKVTVVLQDTATEQGKAWSTFTGVSRGLNGAHFDTTTGKFIEFSDPTNVKCGLSSYIHAGDQIIVTYWSTDIPDFARKNKVFTTFPHASVDVDPEVVSWLCIDMPIQQVGSLDLYQITEVFLGSSKSEGWDLDVYQESGSSIPVRNPL